MTRLAPSPTGALHLGNARTFLINWLLARKNGWNIALRIEDLDGPRIKKGAAQQAMDDLQWLGLGWDHGPIYQSTRFEKYREFVTRLIERRVAYPCVCSRSEVETAASAPHASDLAAIYPATCRDRFESVEDARLAGGREPAIRFRVPDRIVRFTDQFAGKFAWNAVGNLGDFVIAKADGTPSYQLAVVIDDHEMLVTQIVRGDDLLESTARQLLLLDALFPNEPRPAYVHVPLVVGEDGLRLAKRHGDSRLAHYRRHGVTPGRLLNLLARWIGIATNDCDITPRQLLERFDLSRVPRERIVFTRQDEQFLMGSGT